MGIKIINKSEATQYLQNLSDEFVIIKNPEFVHPEFEIVPLAPKIIKPKKLIAAVMDMDGTTTTTEELCIEALEFMVRKMSGLLTKDQWIGLTQKDYPNVIGNSTTKHIEYLIETYFDLIDQNQTINSFLNSIAWTTYEGKSEQRKREVQELLRSLGIPEDFLERHKDLKNYENGFPTEDTINFLKTKINFNDFASLVKIGIEIYYQHYHQYLLSLTTNTLENSKKKLIEPLPGVSIFLALIKGLLGEETENFTELLIEEFKKKNPEIKPKFNLFELKSELRKIGLHFEKNPLRIAIVTSSIFYEADIVLTEVFNQIKKETGTWNISLKRKEKILEYFSSYQNFYDAIVTATDSHEFRLKPHRDLYSIALHRLGISTNDFDKVVGFEDSQSGTIAIRAAGVGCCMAVPFPQTQNHNLEAASLVLLNGLPEFILKHKCLINLE